MIKLNEKFNEDRRDALQEVVNIAMGQAGDSMAKLFDTFVELSIPKFHVSNIDQLRESLAGKEEYREKMTVLRQPFSGELEGEGITLFNTSGTHELATLMGYEGEITLNNEREMILDVCSILVGACLNGIASQLDMSVSYTAPSVVVANTGIADFFTAGSTNWSYALVMEIRLTLEQHSFSSNMLLFLAEDSFEPLIQRLDILLDEL